MNSLSIEFIIYIIYLLFEVIYSRLQNFRNEIAGDDETQSKREQTIFSFIARQKKNNRK